MKRWMYTLLLLPIVVGLFMPVACPANLTLSIAMVSLIALGCGASIALIRADKKFIPGWIGGVLYGGIVIAMFVHLVTG